MNIYSNKTVTSQFSFYKAGQGLFYGGKINVKNFEKQFTFVYDCGTINFIAGQTAILNQEIDFFKHHVCNEEKIIDILFISHFDYDHVSGLKRLLNGFKVKRVVFPYISMYIRQYSLLSILHETEQELVDFPFDDYTRFINNPIGYINEISGTTEIYVINGERLPTNDNYFEEPNIPENTEIEIYPVGELLPNNGISELEMMNIKLFANNLQFYVSDLWEFSTYVRNIDVKVFENLKNCLNKILKKNIVQTITLDEIKYLIINKRAETKKCYETHLNGINSFGLALLHGPINFKSLQSEISWKNEITMESICSCPQRIGHYMEPIQLKFMGTLLMGDTSLRAKNHAKFPKQFKVKFPFINVFQVPHHGSFYNWDFNAFQKLKIGNNIRYRTKFYAVCNFGYGNTFGHPSPVVIRDISHNIILNSQFLRFTNKYLIKYK